MGQQRNNGFAADYIDVASRIKTFREKHPEGCLRPVDPAEPVKIITVGDRTYLQYVAAAYRTPEDPAPGIGIAWEAFPGRTPFTKDSEAMVAETSAWGRAIVAVLAADTKHGVASAEEVQAAKGRSSAPTPAETDPYDGKWLPDGDDNAEGGLADFGSPATAKQVQRIAILRKQLPNLTEDAYRSRLQEVYGVDSAKDLTKAQASKLVKQLEDAAQKAGA